MFKSIQWKLVAMFLLVALAVIIVIGTFTINSVADFYNKDFKNQIEAALTADFTDRLTAALSEEQPEQAVFQTAQVFSARLGINSYRSYYVLDSFGNSLGGEKLAKTDNIITAIGGKVGNKTHSGVGYMDYAYPIPDSDGETRYILYIRDSKEEVYEITRNIFTIILEDNMTVDANNHLYSSESDFEFCFSFTNDEEYTLNTFYNNCKASYYNVELLDIQ